MTTGRSDLSVIVPCLNEEANLPEFVERLARTFERGRIRGEAVLVDDGSTDGSWAVMQGLADRFPFVVPVRHPTNRGIAAAWRSGLESSLGAMVCVIDADLQYQPEDILRLLRTQRETHCDFVQGWRSLVGRKKQPRYHWSRGLNWILNHAFGLNAHDAKSGFVLCPREVLADLLDYRQPYRYWQSFILVAAAAKRYSYREVETLFAERRAGKSFLSDVPVRVIAWVLVDLVRAAVEYRLRPPTRDATQSFLDRSRKDDAVAHDAGRPQTALGGARWWVYRRTFDWTHWVITKEAFRSLHELERSQWLGSDELRALRDIKLRRLVRHAYRHVPYYRERMRTLGVSPDDIRGVDDLPMLPMLTKQDVRDNLYFDILSDNHDKGEILRVSTSGSTGEPFACFVDRSQLEFRWAATLRAMTWTGWRPGDPQLRLWHQTIGMTRSQAWRERADAWLLRRTFIPAYEISDANIESFIRRIEAARPALLDGYAESFNVLARYLKERGRLAIQPRAIMSSAQHLPESSRAIIEASFNCRVFDKYGSREFSGIAYECEAHTGHHVVGEGYVVEIVKGQRTCAPGEIGEVVITDLNNYCLPFIRYRIGDLAEAVDPDFVCPCGRGLPLVGAIQGRVQSVIVGADGQYVPGTFFAHVFKDFDHAVRQFQVVQTRPGAITIRIVPAGRYSREALDGILATLRQYLGARQEIDVAIVEAIEMVRDWKRLQAVSSVHIDLQEATSQADIRFPTASRSSR